MSSISNSGLAAATAAADPRRHSQIPNFHLILDCCQTQDEDKTLLRFNFRSSVQIKGLCTISLLIRYTHQRHHTPSATRCLRYEVSERATHCSSPHGPCVPSARVTDELGPRPTLSPFPKRPLPLEFALAPLTAGYDGSPALLTSFLQRKTVYTSPTIETDVLLADMDDALR
ncbi:hypothetical protein B0H14DRAFT_3492477 [Mycena olivaceomarginata]|nr:hypothetical protein B0H14DRAFT_3492477 [Mycena olivaceomarginata]